jgi:hypothetical protein
MLGPLVLFPGEESVLESPTDVVTEVQVDVASYTTAGLNRLIRKL